MAWFSSKVRVTFIDDATGNSFAVTDLPPTDLPETFELDTTLHLGNEDWTVVAASPMTRAEYAKSKTLTLRLRRVQLMDPREILFSLPSICDAIPGVSIQPLTGGEFALAEDDWRQLEFVSRELAGEADEEIAKIRLIHENASVEGVGWKEIHIRTKPEIPIARNLTLAGLAKALNVLPEPGGVTYHGAQARITDGYSLRIGGLILYGVAPGGVVQVIALSEAAQGAAVVDRLKALAQDLNLDLVNWCRCVRVGVDDPLFVSLLTNDGA
jgi:hypothetical protein